jgi:hypothetical protein
VQHGKGEEDNRNTSRARPDMDSSKRYDVGRKIRHSRELFLQRASTSAPVIIPCRKVIAMMMSHGDRCRVFVRVSEIRDSKAL